jgi:hypothetical protein
VIWSRFISSKKMMQTQSLSRQRFFQKKLKRDPAADRASPSRSQSGRAARAQTVRPVHFLALRHTFKSSG